MKLFRNIEELMKEDMLNGPIPVGRDVKGMSQALISPSGNKILTTRYNIGFTSNLTNIELGYLGSFFKENEIGLALYRECGFFFTNTQRMTINKEKLINLTANEESSIAWVGLVRYAWENGIGLASVDTYLEGFEVKIYRKGQKIKKTFLKKVPNTMVEKFFLRRHFS